MSREKFIFEEVKLKIESYGHELISKEYEGALTKLTIKCINNHTFTRTLSGFNKNKDCPVCKKETIKNSIISSVIKEFDDYGFIILNGINEYINSYSYFIIQCPNEHIYKERVCYFKSKHTCPYCSKKVKLKIEDIYSEFLNNNMLLLTNQYINSNTKMPYICLFHPDKINHITWSNFSRGVRCPDCARERIPKLRTLDQEFVFNYFYKKDYTLLPNQTYINCKLPLYFICNKHPNIIQSGDYNHLKQRGNICTFCRREKTSGEKHYNWKGGISNLTEYLREHILPWKYDSAKTSNNRCIITGKSTNCIIHHLYPFNKILLETMSKLNLPIYQEINQYTEDELKLIINTCLELHYKYGLGVRLTKELHNEFHKIYGHTDFTLRDFYEFQYNKMIELCLI